VSKGSRTRFAPCYLRIRRFTVGDELNRIFTMLNWVFDNCGFAMRRRVVVRNGDCPRWPDTVDTDQINCLRDAMKKETPMRSSPHRTSSGSASMRTHGLSKSAGSRPQPENRPRPRGVTLPIEERRSLCASLLGLAAKYIAVSTEAPKLPKEMALPLERQIALLRSLRGWTQTELAGHAGVSQTDVSRAESASPLANEAAVNRICDVLNIPR